MTNSPYGDGVPLDPEMALRLVKAERDLLLWKLRTDLDEGLKSTDARLQRVLADLDTNASAVAASAHDIRQLQQVTAGEIRQLQEDRDSLLRSVRALWQTVDTFQVTAREDRVRTMAALSRPESAVVVPADLLEPAPPGLDAQATESAQARDYRRIAASALFDATWYLATYPDVATAGVDPALHFLREGGAEGRWPGPHFDPGLYLDANPDVRTSGVNPLLHYLTNGVLQGRSLGLPLPEAPPEDPPRSVPDTPAIDPEPPRRMNEFVYAECDARDIAHPDIPVFLVEQYGQCAEDLIVSSLLQAWADKHGFDLTKATYLEIGGNHPIATSASFLLHRVHGMRGVVIEANPELVPALEKVRDFDKVVFGAMQAEDVPKVMLSVSHLSELSSLDPSFVKNWAGGSVGERQQIEVPALRINPVIETYFGGLAPHFLSIDIESLDLPVMQDLDFERFRPVVIQAEPSDHHVPGNTKQMIAFMRGKDYALVAKTPVNLIFMSIEALTDPGDAERGRLAPSFHAGLPTRGTLEL